MLTYDSLTRTPAVKEWVQSEQARGKRHLDLFATRLEHMNHRKGARILRIFLKSMYGFDKRFAKTNPDLFHVTTSTSPLHLGVESTSLGQRTGT